MSDPDSPRIATVMLSEREVRALQLLVVTLETLRQADAPIGLNAAYALPYAEAAVQKLTARFLR